MYILIPLLLSSPSIFAVQAKVTIDRVSREERESIDPCSRFTSCASCVGARYYSGKEKTWKIGDLRYSEASASERKAFIRRMSIGAVDCRWNIVNEECSPATESLESEYARQGMANTITNTGNEDEHKYIKYQYSCPFSPKYPTNETVPFLPDWMSSLMTIRAFSAMPLSSLSLPGTHDSISYDLSLTISSDGIENFNKLSFWLRKLSIIHPGEVEEFIRLQAQAQKLDIVQQLDNGVRFIDFRIMMEDNDDDWFSVHCMQSTRPALDYLKSIRTWMNDHPHEIIVIWFSRQGSTDAEGNDAYPNISPEQKQDFWRSYQDTFDDLLFDTSISDYFSTPISDLIDSNQRLITFVSDYAEFTNHSKFAYNAKIIENFFHSDGVFNEESTIQRQRDYFHHGMRMASSGTDVSGNVSDDSRGQSQNSTDKIFYLMSMNTPSNIWQVESAARHRFLPVDLFDSCAKNVNIPSSHSFCPQNLLDITQLTNYYNQISIEEAYQDFICENNDDDVSFPNAFYLDALDYNGTLRTGTELLIGSIHPDAKEEHFLSRYAFVDTVIGYNLHLICKFSNGSNSLDDDACATYKDFIESRRARYPLTLWREPEYGRLDDWP